ncbi:MAG: AAA family ATPase [Rhodoferax sp.]|nr:AAA family ATPase [Rhodoferax sp.]
MSAEQHQLEAAIAALESQRALLGDSLIETALRPLRSRLANITAAPELKHVSILFLDIVGSTTLSRKLDPEEVHATMDGALEVYTGLVQARGGKVLNFAGDNLLAVFGADITREDDAERAVLAGLDLLQEGKHQEALVDQKYGHAGFNVRVGVHSGGVLLGGGMESDKNIRGFHVNFAARMEQSAPAGGMRISHDCYRHVSGIFDLRAQAPIEVKGVEEPVTTYLVVGRKPRSFAQTECGIEGVETPMIGRAAELGVLQTAFARLRSEPGFFTVNVVAEAGMGKSRLLSEFEKWAHVQAQASYFLQCRAHAITQNQAYGVLRDILAWRFQIGDGDSAAVAREKFEGGLIPFFNATDPPEVAESHVHLLGHLIGIGYADSRHIRGIREDAQQIRSRAFHAAALWLRRVGTQLGMPVVLLLDDLHWADRESLDFWNYLGQVNQDVAMLTVSFSRPMPEKAFIHSGVAVNGLRIALKALDPEAIKTLAGELLKMLPDVPAALGTLVADGAEGNPFYMEELVKMLIDEGAIVPAAGHWSVRPEKVDAAQVPPTLTGIIQSRLDRLKPQEKLTLQRASVIGSVFWDQVLHTLGDGAEDALEKLAQHRLVAPQPSADMDDARGFSFAHHILHHATYDTLLKRTRQQLHAHAAQWFCRRAASSNKDYSNTTAHHFLQAGDHAQAADYLTRAAEQAAARYAKDAALAYVRQALELLEGAAQPEPATACDVPSLLRWRLLDLREKVFDLEGRRAEQHADIEALVHLADALQDDRKRSEAARRKCVYDMRTDDFVSMQAAAIRAIAFAERAGDTVLLLRGQHRLALALHYLGDTAAGIALAQQGLAQTQRLGERALEALFLNASSVLMDGQFDQLASLHLDEQDLQINRELGNRRNEAIALSNLGHGWLSLGDNQRALQYMEQSLQLAQAVGDRATEPITRVALATIALRAGDAVQALAHAQAAADRAREVGSPDLEAIALCAMGDACLELARLEPGQQAFVSAAAIAERLDQATRFDAWAGLARVALLQQHYQQALALTEQVLEHSDNCVALDSTESPCQIRLTCYQVLAKVGDPRASEQLSASYHTLQSIAATISDAVLLEQFFNAIPENQATVAAWEQLSQDDSQRSAATKMSVNKGNN